MIFHKLNKKYSIIYADPPYTYKVWNKKTGNGRSACNHYDTMNNNDLKSLPIETITEKNAVLFLWVPPPCLLEGIELMKSWGFTYKTIAFTWIKKNKKQDTLFMGMGYYTRSNSELCLLGTKGKVLPRKSHSVHQVIIDPIRKHSQKPDEARDRIVQLFGDLPRIELFARNKTEGWDVWGKEVDIK